MFATKVTGFMINSADVLQFDQRKIGQVFVSCSGAEPRNVDEPEPRSALRRPLATMARLLWPRLRTREDANP
jgi:hypothetical protein